MRTDTHPTHLIHTQILTSSLAPHTNPRQDANRAFTPEDWVLLENADPQLARHQLFQIDTIEENSAVLKWATLDHHIHLDNLYWLIPDQTEVQPLGALSHARVESLTFPSGRTAVLFNAEEETAPYPHSNTLTQTRRLPSAKTKEKRPV